MGTMGNNNIQFIMDYLIYDNFGRDHKLKVQFQYKWHFSTLTFIFSLDKHQVEIHRHEQQSSTDPIKEIIRKKSWSCESWFVGEPYIYLARRLTQVVWHYQR